MKKMFALFFLGISMATGCAYQHRVLVNPEVSVPPKAPSSEVRQTVRQALTDYGWTIEKEEPGVTTAHLHQDELYAHIAVEYTSTLATVRYLDSKNFRYEKLPNGEERIHSHYLVWAHNIADRINKNLNLAPH